jgi:hypothetical protein
MLEATPTAKAPAQAGVNVGHAGPIVHVLRQTIASGPELNVAQSDVDVMSAYPARSICPNRSFLRSAGPATSTTGVAQCGQRWATSTPRCPHVASPVSALCPMLAMATVCRKSGDGSAVAPAAGESAHVIADAVATRANPSDFCACESSDKIGRFRGRFRESFGWNEP